MIMKRFQPAVWPSPGLLLAPSCLDSERLYPTAGERPSSAGEAGAWSEAGASSAAGRFKP